MSKLTITIALLLVSISPSLVAADHWIRLTTPHFEMYTTNSEKQGSAALEVFEQVRYFFLQNNKSKNGAGYRGANYRVPVREGVQAIPLE